MSVSTKFLRGALSTFARQKDREYPRLRTALFLEHGLQAHQSGACVMSEENSPEHEITTALSKGYGSRVARFVLACLGSVPAVGGAVGGVGGAWSEAEQAHYNKVFAAWLKLQEDEVKEIGITVAEILSRLDLNDEAISSRIESPEYLKLIKKCFRDWSAAESEEKRILIRNLLTNAAVHQICSDDVLRMFIQ